jgi:hypothetical protein
MNTAVANAIATLERESSNAPIYHIYALSRGISIVVRRAYKGAPVIWFEWDQMEPSSIYAFENFTRGYSHVQPHSAGPLSGRIVLDGYWGSESQGPSSR